MSSMYQSSFPAPPSCAAVCMYVGVCVSLPRALDPLCSVAPCKLLRSPHSAAQLTASRRLWNTIPPLPTHSRKPCLPFPGPDLCPPCLPALYTSKKATRTTPSGEDDGLCGRWLRAVLAVLSMASGLCRVDTTMACGCRAKNISRLGFRDTRPLPSSGWDQNGSLSGNSPVRELSFLCLRPSPSASVSLLST